MKILLKVIIIFLSINSGICQNKKAELIMGKNISLEQIDSLSGMSLIHEVFVSIVIKQTSNFKSKREFLESLPFEQQMVYSIWILDMNVNNGGFLQYYHNSNGEIYNLSLDAAKEMGMEKIAVIVEKGNKIFLENNSNAKFQSEIEFTESQIKSLSNLNREYYQEDKDKFIYNSISNYIKSNKNKFIIKGL